MATYKASVLLTCTDFAVQVQVCCVWSFKTTDVYDDQEARALASWKALEERVA